MALNFNGTSHQVSHNDASLDGVSPITIWIRVQLSDLATNQNFYVVHGTGAPTFDRGLFSQTNGFVNLSREYSGTNMEMTASADGIPLNTWQDWFIVDAGASSNPRAYFGNLDADLAEVASYSTQVAPTGTPGAASFDWQIGRRDNTRRITGDISRMGMWSAGLTLGQCRQVRHRPFSRTDLLVFSEYGYNGVATQPDWSGNGVSGTVTGATQVDHAPGPPLFGFDSDLGYPLIAVTPELPAARPAWNYRIHA